MLLPGIEIISSMRTIALQSTVAAILLFPPWTGHAATTLFAGDVSFTQYHGDLHTAGVGGVGGDDFFSFIIWKAIDATTKISFTDHGYNGGVLYNDAEGALEWTSGTSMPAGTVVSVNKLSSQNSFTSTKGSIAPVSLPGSSLTNFSLASSGDQIFAFQGTFSDVGDPDGGRITGTLLHAFQADNTGWDLSPVADIGPNSSMVPSGASNFVMTLGGEVDNGFYSGTRTFTSVAAAQAAVGNIANWTLNDTENTFVANDSNFTIVPEPGTSALLLVGLGAIGLHRRRSSQGRVPLVSEVAL